MDTPKDIVVVGAGQAGAQAVQSLRQFGYEGKLTLIGEETALPYQRPPLSKAFLKGEMSEDRLYFKPAAWYEDSNIETILSEPVTAIDRKERRVQLQHGGALPYDALILATGSRPRRLSVDGASLKNVFDLRDLADVERLRPQMIEGHRIVIIGAGYIGLEAAAVARQMGLHVTVLEMMDRVLARVTSPLISDFYQAQHAAQGVNIRLGARVTLLRGKDGAVDSVVLDDGEELPADMVLSGIGIVPNVELAEAAGLACDNGISVDEDARTSDPAIFACGDCASRPLVHYGRKGRLESVHNAIEQGKLAAAAIMCRDRPALDCPWFWSDQYDLKLQIAGLSTGFDEIAVRGDVEAKKFAAFYFEDGRLIACDAINSPAEFITAKRLIIAGARIAPSRLSDPAEDLRAIAKEFS